MGQLGTVANFLGVGEHQKYRKGGKMQTVTSEYREISPVDLERAQGNAWSIESMEGHDAGGRSVTYIGSKRDEKHPYLIWDYFRDSSGAYWFQNRAIKGGQIVSMDVYIFGREIRKERKAWKKNT